MFNNGKRVKITGNVCVLEKRTVIDLNRRQWIIFCSLLKHHVLEWYIRCFTIAAHYIQPKHQMIIQCMMFGSNTGYHPFEATLCNDTILLQVVQAGTVHTPFGTTAEREVMIMRNSRAFL